MTARRLHGAVLCTLLLMAGVADTSLGQFMVNVQGPNPSLTITTGTPSGGPTPVINTATRLRYRRGVAPSKVTVSTSCPGQSFNLRVLATQVTRGTPAPEVNLLTGMPALDFIIGIPAGFLNQESASLRYTASSTYQQGHSIDFGNDVHVVTYTLVAQ